MALRAADIFPPLEEPPMNDALFLLATVYRIIYGIVGSYIIAWLAPDRPMRYALIGGIVGLAASVMGAVATVGSTDLNSGGSSMFTAHCQQNGCGL